MGDSGGVIHAQEEEMGCLEVLAGACQVGSCVCSLLAWLTGIIVCQKGRDRLMAPQNAYHEVVEVEQLHHVGCCVMFYVSQQIGEQGPYSCSFLIAG